MKNNKITEFKLSEQQKIIAKSRNGVISMNRIFMFASISISLLLLFLFSGTWYWIFPIFISGYIFSIINSYNASNRVKKATDLSHGEQAVMWYNIKADYEALKKEKNCQNQD